MLALKILLCICAFISLYACRKIFLDTSEPNKRRYTLISIGCFFGFSIALGLTVYLTNYNHFYGIKVLVFAIVCLYIVFRSNYSDIGFYILLIGIIITIVAYFFVYIIHTEDCEQPTVTTSTTYILSANDTFKVSGSVSGSRFYVSGSIDEQLVYYYYYKNEAGNILSGHIPANLTEIIPMEGEDELPRIVKIIETPCYMDYNTNPPEHVLVDDNAVVVRYKLYVPATSAPKEFILDLN